MSQFGFPKMKVWLTYAYYQFKNVDKLVELLFDEKPNVSGAALEALYELDNNFFFECSVRNLSSDPTNLRRRYTCFVRNIFWRIFSIEVFGR